MRTITIKRRTGVCLWAFLACLSIGFLARGIEPAQSGPGVNTLDPKIAAEIEKVVAAFDQPGRPGCVLGILKDGQVVYARGHGLANLEYGVPVGADTIFEAGSVAKQFTAAAVQILAAEGKLALDDDIRKYLPEVPAFGAVITVRHLLNHTSGLRDQWDLLDLEGRPAGSVVHTMDEILDLVSRQKDLNFKPGDEYLYSNTNYSLLAWIIRRAAGRSLADFSGERIFRPLGMSHTQWRDDYRRIVAGRATAYSAGPNGTFLQSMPFTNVYGNGGLLTTIGDLLVWAENFWTPRVLGRERLDEMESPGRLNDGSTISYGLGLSMSEHRGLRQITHSGSTAGYRAYLVRFPAEHTAIAYLSNFAGVDGSDIAHKVADILLEGRLKAKPKLQPFKPAPERLAQLAGLYRNMKTGAVLKLGVKGEGLVIQGGGRPSALVPVAADRFVTENGTEFVFEPAGPAAPSGLREKPLTDPLSIYARVEQARPGPEKLAEYEGRYWSEELDVTYAVAVRDGRLTVARRLEPPTPLGPADEDGFTPGGASQIAIRFTRNASGAVDGLSIYTGRLRHLRFVKRG
jgi:CubicO group peptidase (beta-lactamase class C family)